MGRNIRTPTHSFSLAGGEKRSQQTAAAAAAIQKLASSVCILTILWG